jgi:DedD protein
MAWFKFGKRSDSVNTQQGPTESVEAMRRRAKFRLIGSVVLVLAGVVGFPMLFDSQPRSVPVDIPIDIPDKAKVKPLSVPGTPSQAASPAPAAKVEDVASLSGKEEIIVTGSAPKSAAKTPEAKANTAQPATKSIVAGAAVAGATAAAAAAIAGGGDDAAKAKAAANKAAADKDKADKADKAKASADKLAKDKADKAALEASRAKALLDGKPADTSSSAAAAKPADKAAEKNDAQATRYIVQFGAFTDAEKAREVRQKVEKAGLKTYSQIAKTADGERIRVRVGPFATKDEADKAAEKIKALSLPASVLTL